MNEILEPTIRMFVDENGHQTLKGDLSNDNNRFLCLTGVIMRLDDHLTLGNELNELKVKCFGSNAVVLHRRELIPGKPPFEALTNSDVRECFNATLLKIIKELPYRVISVLVDKKAHVEKYGVLRARDPYALALEYLMQRYQYWLQAYCEQCGHVYGDILAESRGGSEDRITKLTYNEIYNGRGYNPLKNASYYFSSKEIKLKPKSANIAGLQFVDLLSHPARRYILSQRGLAKDIQASSYEQQIVDVLVESKFRRSKHGVIAGSGIVFFP
jgi:hypothetical protein